MLVNTVNLAALTSVVPVFQLVLQILSSHSHIKLPVSKSYLLMSHRLKASVVSSIWTSIVWNVALCTTTCSCHHHNSSTILHAKCLFSKYTIISLLDAAKALVNKPCRRHAVGSKERRKVTCMNSARRSKSFCVTGFTCQMYFPLKPFDKNLAHLPCQVWGSPHLFLFWTFVYTMSCWLLRQKTSMLPYLHLLKPGNNAINNFWQVSKDSCYIIVPEGQ